MLKTFGVTLKTVMKILAKEIATYEFQRGFFFTSYYTTFLASD